MLVAELNAHFFFLIKQMQEKKSPDLVRSHF